MGIGDNLVSCIDYTVSNYCLTEIVFSLSKNSEGF